MKKFYMLILVFFVVTAVTAQTKTYYYPGSGTPIISVKVPTTWVASNEATYLSVQPDDNTDYGRMIAMIWESGDPSADDAITKLVEEGFDLVETMLTDIKWDEETSDFEFNGIDFVAIDGWGKYSNKDGSKEEMMATVMIFFPDDDNLMTLVYIGLEKAYTKHKEEFLGIIQSISPY